MPLTFFIPTELDISGALTVGGNLISATGGRLQAGSGSNSTLMATDSGAFANLVALLAASGALAAQTAASGQALYNFATGISGALENIIINDTTLTVSGSSSLSTINFIGVGGMLVTLSGTGTLVFSGGGGAGGSFDPLGTAAASGQTLYGLTTGASGSLLTPAQISLAGGTGLNLNTYYYDTFAANRTVGFLQVPYNGCFVTLLGNVTSQCTLQFPQSNRVGQPGTVTGVVLNAGSQELSWIFANTNWWLVDSTSAVNNTSAARTPTVTDDSTSGYAVGSLWVNTGALQPYTCLNATSGAAIWFAFGTGNGGGGSFDPLGTAAATGVILYNLITNGSGALSVGVSGSVNVPNPDFFGAGNIFVTLSGNAGVYISGGTGLALAANLGASGQALYADIIAASGLLQTQANLAATATNLTTSGQTLYTDILATSGVFNARPKPIGFAVDGAGSVIVSGIKSYIVCPYAGNIASWSLVGDQAGSIFVDIYKIASGATLPTTSIIGANGIAPSLSSAAAAFSTSTISTWATTTVALNDIIGWVVTGVPTALTKLTFQLIIT